YNRHKKFYKRKYLKCGIQKFLVLKRNVSLHSVVNCSKIYLCNRSFLFIYMLYIKALRKGNLPGSPVLKRKGEARNAQKQDVQTCAGW
ncbi:hypothetical protein, partial [uncultured Dialister sp.]|uniref:hypothetical protein n=1 Tax=uncultured Dialister sp. TaxID=278064 RepID=UPI00262ECCB4